MENICCVWADQRGNDFSVLNRRLSGCGCSIGWNRFQWHLHTASLSSPQSRQGEVHTDWRLLQSVAFRLGAIPRKVRVSAPVFCKMFQFFHLSHSLSYNVTNNEGFSLLKLAVKFPLPFCLFVLKSFRCNAYCLLHRRHKHSIYALHSLTYLELYQQGPNHRVKVST